MDSEFYRPLVSVPPSAEYKWSKNVMEEGFVPFPKKFLRTMIHVFEHHPHTGKATPMEKLAVVLAIADFKKEKSKRPPSLKYLSFLADMASERFEIVLKELEREKLVTVSEMETGLKITMDGLLKKIEQFSEAKHKAPPAIGPEDI